VIRPADANETIQAWADAVLHDGPTAIVLSRQNIAVTTNGEAVCTGAAIVYSTEYPQVVLAATGSEVALCTEAAQKLAATGITAQVVSMPSWDRFDEQSDDFKADIFPKGIPVLSVEAGVTFGWAKYANTSIGIDRFGASAPGGLVLDKLGINVDNVVAHATALVT
jgi:transketolase